MRSLLLSFSLIAALGVAIPTQAAPLADREARQQQTAAPGQSLAAALGVRPAGVYGVAGRLGAIGLPERPVVALAPSPRIEGTLTGNITDARTGEPVRAAQVFIRAIDVGVLSNEDGRYLMLNVPDGTHSVSVELIGYESASAEVTITSGATVVQDFRLAQQAVSLEAIVVTGVPGGTRRRAIGNSVGTLDGSAVTNVAPVAGVQDVLRGRSPSVNMMGGGMVGQAPRVRIRGASAFSLTGQPLVYIDGVRVNNEETTGFTFGNNAGVRGMLSSIDPEQIESIEVLKGPAAATLYGTQASRGVINIITRRGGEGRARVDVMVRQGANFMANASSKIGYENFWTHPTTGATSSLNMVDHYDAIGANPYSAGSVQLYNASLTGGSQDTQYFFSGTYSDETGVLSHNWAKKLNLRTNIDSRVTDNLGFNLSMGYTNSRDRLPTDGFSSITEGVEFGSPRFLPANRCDTNPGFGCDVFQGSVVQGVPARDRSLVNQQDLDRFTAGVTFDHSAFGWLSTRLTSGVDYTGELNAAFREFQTNDTTVVSLGANARRGFRNEGRWSHFLTTTDVSSTAEFSLTPALTSASSVGFQYYTRTTSFLQATGQQFAGPGLSTITSTAIQGTPTNNEVTDNTLGLYVQETVGLNDRLFLTGAVRVDNNSAFGADIDLVTYPKFALSWVMTEEPWFADLAPSWVNSFRLRAAWGQSGEAPAAFSALRTWSAVTGPNGTAGVTPNTVGNPDLTAEVGEEIEIGFDTDLFDRLGLQFTYYDKLTKGAILQRDLAPSGGFTGQQFVNAGRIVNSGLELGLNALILENEGLRWDLGFNLSYNTGEIQQLSGQAGDTTIVFNSWSSMEHRVGHAPFSWFGVDVVSSDLDQDGNTVNAMCSDGVGGTTPCFDAGGSTIAPRVNLGRAIAPWEMSLSADVAVGDNLRFHALFTSERGHKRFDNTLRQRCRLYRICEANAFPERWDPIMKATVESSDQIIDAWVNDASFIRLKEISVSYDLPQSLVEDFGMSRAVWQLAGRNLLTFTDWTASDPEVMFSSGGRAFMAQNNLPQPQQIATSIRFSF